GDTRAQPAAALMANFIMPPCGHDKINAKHLFYPIWPGRSLPVNIVAWYPGFVLRLRRCGIGPHSSFYADRQHWL
ncbi:hypothetical protein, partial [Anaerotruncus colihominis]|uniref:hypothetical protein n=1 Tax=Anaerotruncus colihominis TaxID=169435 RepID=UPI0026F365B0